MILSIRSDSLQRTRKVANTVWSVFSPLALAVMFGIAVAWTLERAPSQTFVSTENRIVVSPGIDLGKVVPPMLLSVEAQKAVYRLRIEDASGATVYIFPDQIVKNPGDFSVGAAYFPLPSIRPGNYTVRLQVIYPFNPFKNGSITITSFLTVN